MTTSESKGRFFAKTNRFETIRITNRIESIRIVNWNALVNSLPKTVTRQRLRFEPGRPGPSAPESSTLTARLPSHPGSVNNCQPLKS